MSADGPVPVVGLMASVTLEMGPLCVPEWSLDKATWESGGGQKREGREEGRKEGGKEGRKEGRK